MNFRHSTLQAVQLPASGPSTYPAMTGCRHFDAPVQNAAHPNMFTDGNPLTFHKQVSCHE